VTSPRPAAAQPAGATAGLAKPAVPVASKRYRGKVKSTYGRAGARKKVSRQNKLFATKAGARAKPAAAKPRAKPAGKGKGGDAIDDILRNFK
jgi:hypothetical protein